MSKIIFAVLIILSSAMTARSQANNSIIYELEFNLPLKQCIHSSMNLPYGNVINKTNALSVEKLVCDARQIESLDGIQYFTNLKEINFTYYDSQRYSTQIEDISLLAGLTQLENLCISGGKIKDISPLAGLTRLRNLLLARNSISNIEALRGLTGLRILHLSMQDAPYITDISPLANLTNMRELYLGHNRIADISALASMIYLHTLHLQDNRIASLAPLANLTRLTTVELNVNMISDLSPLYASSTMTTLLVARNRLASLNFTNSLTRLQTLNIEGNNISDLSPLNQLLLGNTKADFTLVENQITTLTPIAQMFWDEKVGTIRLGFNCIPENELDRDKSPYLKKISQFYPGLQCVPAPPMNDPNIVNTDLLNYNASDLSQDTVDAVKNSPASSAGGCSIAGGSPYGDLLLLLICVIWLRQRVLR